MAYWKFCDVGREPDDCVVIDIASWLPIGIDGNDNKRLCPCHDDTEASLSINAGKKGQRVVWNCHAGCAREDVRLALIDLGISERCLGDYAKPLRLIVPGMQVQGYDPALVADSKRLHAIAKLPASLSGHYYKMCVQAILEGDGDLPGDPFRLLPVDQAEFVALAARAGIERSYRYKLWARWLRSDAA